VAKGGEQSCPKWARVNNGAQGEPMTRSQADLDNHANQLNPNNDAYWSSRDEDKPADTEPANEKPSNND
jgi:hypothetical protein